MVKLITNITEIPLDKKIVIDFFANWCGPCKTVAPEFTRLDSVYNDIVFLKVDVENNDSQELTKKFKIKSLPTFIFLNNGITIDTVIGSAKLVDRLKFLHNI